MKFSVRDDDPECRAHSEEHALANVVVANLYRGEDECQWGGRVPAGIRYHEEILNLCS